MDLTAYALRAEYEGTVEIDGEPQPVFQGGVLAVGDGDFDVAKELQAGGGIIVVQQADQVLVDLLDSYPALKRTTAPDEPDRVVSPYERQPTAQLRHLASLRDIDGHGGASRGQLEDALAAQDEAAASGDQAAVASASVEDRPDGLDRLKKAELVDLAGDTVDLAGANTNADIIARLREAGVTATEEA